MGNFFRAGCLELPEAAVLVDESVGDLLFAGLFEAVNSLLNALLWLTKSQSE